MHAIQRFIRQHPLVSFFALTFLSSWLLLLIYVLSNYQELFSLLGLLGLFCPAFMAILVARIVYPTPDGNSQKARRIAFWAAWLSATAGFTLYTAQTSGLESPIAIVIYAILALPPAFIVSSAYSRFPGIRTVLASLLKPKGAAGWYLFALLVPWIIKWLSAPLNAWLGWQAYSEPQVAITPLAWFGLVGATFMYMFFFAGGVNEETGWSGFALPRLQAKFNPLLASLVLWALWILWHLPYQLAGLWNTDPLDFARALVSTLFARFLFTWLFNRTRGGLLSAVLFHTSANVSFVFLPATPVHMILEALLSIGVIIAARMWQKRPPGDPAMWNDKR